MKARTNPTPNASPNLDAESILEAPLSTTPGSSHAQVVEMPLADLTDSPFQPRLRALTKADVRELMDSIKANGQTAPIIVEPAKGTASNDEPGEGASLEGEAHTKYYVHAGHRRCAALRFLGRETVQAVVRHDLDERAARKLSLADNLAREDLTAFEQATALKGYCDAFDLSLEGAAEELGLRRRTAFRLKTILAAPEPVQLVIRERALSARAAELVAKIGTRRPKRAIKLADKVADGKMSIKALEGEARTGRSRATPEDTEPKDVAVKATTDRVTLKLDLIREERTSEQLVRVRNAIGTVLANLGIEHVNAAQAAETVES